MDEERRLIDEHGRYFQERFASGRVLLFGPVMATGGAFGSLCAKSRAKLRLDDLAKATFVRAGLNRFELYPRQVSAARAKTG